MAGSDVKTKILDIQVRYKDALDQIAKYRKEVADAMARQKELKEELNEGNISQEEYARQLETTRIFINQQNTAINTLTRQINNQEKAQQENLGSLVQWRAELSNLTGAYDRLSEVDREGEIGKNLKEQINELTNKLKEAEQGTQRFFRNVGNYPSAMGQAANATNGLVEALTKECKTAEEAKEANEILHRALESIDPAAEGASEAIETLSKKIEENNEVIEEGAQESEELVDAMGELIGVNTKFGSTLQALSKNSAGSVLEGLNVKAKALWSTLTGLLANPYVLAFLGIAGVAMAFKWWYDFNKGLEEASRLTKQFTGLAGDDMRAYRDQVTALCDVFGDDFQDVLESADALVAQFGISWQEALDDIKKGYEAAGNIGGDMLDKIQSMPAAFNEMGLSAKQYMAIISQTSTGLWGDKGMNALKEGNERIREMSAATSKSLQTIGIDAEQVQKDIADGSKTTFEVLQEVAGKLKELSPDAQVVGETLKNVFGQQGVEAGAKMIGTIADLNTNLEECVEQQGALAKIQEEQFNAQTELNAALSALFDTTGGTFETMTGNAKLFVTKGITAIVKGLVDVVNWFIELYNNSLVVRAGIANVTLQFKTGWSIIKNICKLIADEIIGLANIIKGALTLNWDDVKSGWDQFRKASVKAVGSIVNETVENTRDAWSQMNKKLDKVTIKTSTEAASKTEQPPTGSGTPVTKTDTAKKDTSSTSGSKNTAADAAKAEAELLRKAEDELLKITKQAVETRRKQLELSYNRQIEDYRKKLEEDKTLTEKSREAILSIISSLEKQKEQAIAEFNAEEIRKQVEHDSKLIELKLSAAEEGTKQELALKLQGIEEKEKLDLAQAERDYENEVERQEALAAIRAKYQKERESTEDEHKTIIIERQKQVLQNEISQIEIAETEKQLRRKNLRTMTDEEMEVERQRKLEFIGGYEAEKLRLEEESARQAYELLIERGQLSTQTDAEWLAEQNTVKQEWLSKQVAINDAYVKNEQAKQQAVRSVSNGLISILENVGDENSEFAKMAKVIALAQIAIDTGRAISSGVASATSLPYPANLVAIATTVGTVLANIATAISTVKSAKFAAGGKVTGPGSGTSDSIPAMLSNGEYVMTARATRLYEPLLAAMNGIGAGVPIQVANSYESVDNAERLSDSFEKAAREIKPVVSVVEISEAQNRVELIENLDNF